MTRDLAAGCVRTPATTCTESVVCCPRVKDGARAGRDRAWLISPVRGVLFAVVALLVLARPSLVFAATTVPASTISTNTTWTTSGSPYVITGNVTVASGATLTINGGVIVKFQPNGVSSRKITIQSGGGLVASAGSTIYFTSLKDDSVGGDTGADGPTTCVAGDGGLIEIQSANPSNLIANAVFRCSGYGVAQADSWVKLTGSAPYLNATDVDMSLIKSSAFYVGGAGTLMLARTTITEPKSTGVVVVGNSTGYVEDITITGTYAGGTSAGAFGRGIHVEDSYARVTRAELNHLEFGAVVKFTSASATGSASIFIRNNIHYNYRGIYVDLPAGTPVPTSKLPYGHENNIFDNNPTSPDGNQLTGMGTSTYAGADWSNNYWGSTADWYQNPGVCPDPGYVAHSTATPSAAKSPAARTSYVQGFPGVPCTKNYPYLGGPGGFARTPFGFSAGSNDPYLPDGATLGGMENFWLKLLNALANDPVATSSGNFNHQETDIELPGKGLPFRFVRSYNSLDQTTGGVMGRGWTFNLNASLELLLSGDAIAHTEDGAQLPFKRDSSGAYKAASGVLGKLEAISGGYRLTRRDGTKYEFNTSGKLTALLDRNGQGLALSYTSGLLTSISDSASRTITLSYTSGKLTGLSVPDGRSVSYTYNGNGQLATVTDVRGKVWTFTYDTNLMLTKEVSPLSDEVFRNVYDATTSRVTDQYDPLGNHTTFAWNAATQTATVTDPLGKQTVDVFDHNMLVSRTDPLGHATNYTYDDDGNIASTTDQRGNTTTFTYDARGNMLTRTVPAPLSFTETWTYNSLDEILTFTNGRNKTWTYTYDSNGNRLSETRPGAGSSTTFTYSAAGQLLTVTDERSKTTTFTYDSAGNRITATDPLGNLTTYAYNSAGRMTSTVDARGNIAGGTPSLYTTSLTYDNAGHKLTVTNPLGKVTTFTYDNSGRLATTTNALSKTWTYGYNAANDVTSVTAPNSSSETRTYTARGELATATSAAGRTTSFTYDDAGRLASKVVPRGNVVGATPSDYTWSYGYDNAGNLASVTDPLGHATSNTYDAIGRLASTTDPLSHTVSYGYDNAGNLTTVTDPLSHDTTYAYNDRDERTSVTNARGKTTSYGRDAAGNLTSITDSSGGVTTYSYDDAGHKATMVDPRGNVAGGTPSLYTTTYSYDELGNLTSATDPLSHTWSRTYTRNGRVATTTDPLSHVTTYAYDDIDRLTSVTAPDTTVTTYSYDNNTNDLIGRTDAKSHSTSYAYDLDHQLTSVTNPLSKTWSFDYDADGNLIQRVDAIANAASNPSLGTIDYVFDRAGRQTALNYSDSTPDVTFGYDSANRLTSVVDGAGTKTYGYDNANRLTSVTRGSDAFAYAYNDSDSLTEVTYPGGTDVDYTYDDAERLLSLTRGGDTVDYDYDAAGNLVERALPNGVTETRSYDNAGRLANVGAANGSTTLTAFAITRDAAGNPAEVNGAGGAVEKYTYDQLNRITSVCYQSSCPSGSDPKIAWTYDDVGNRATETRPVGTTTYTYNAADQLTSSAAPGGTTNYTYDDNGRQLTAGSSSYAWNVADQLVSATVGSTTTTFSYDGTGNRLSAAISGGSTTNSLWDENAQLPQLALERDGSGNLLRRYLHDLTGPLQLRTGGTDYWYLLDQGGSVAGLADASGALARSTTYEPFGTTRSDTAVIAGTPTTPLAFDGQYLDSNTQLYNLRARQYATNIGRFLTVDPLAPALTNPYISAYVYANDRPTLFADPSGLRPSLSDVVDSLPEVAVDAIDDVLQSLPGGQLAGRVGIEAIVESNIDSLKLGWECVSGTLTDGRVLTRQCLKAAIIAASIGIPVGRLSLPLRSAEGRALISRLVAAKGVPRFWTSREVAGRRVYQRDSLIDPMRTNARGETSLELMRRGRAPIGPDGQPVQLHHMIQREPGPVAEITQTLHGRVAGTLHINPSNTLPSGIDRPGFKTWKEDYWRKRAEDFGG